MKIIISVREYDIKTPQYDRIDQVLNGKDYSLAPPRVPAPPSGICGGINQGINYFDK